MTCAEILDQAMAIDVYSECSVFRSYRLSMTTKSAASPNCSLRAVEPAIAVRPSYPIPACVCAHARTCRSQAVRGIC